MNKVFCPKCNEKVTYHIINETINKYKGYNLNVEQNIAACDKCNEKIYASQLESDNLKRLYEKYRELSLLITPQEIINFRKRYNISQRELVLILDWGKMTINRYERGSLASQSHSDIIKIIIKDEKYFNEKVENAYLNKRITEKTYFNIKSKMNTTHNIFSDRILEESETYGLKQPQKVFNTTGVCVDNIHYMVNIDNKLSQIIQLINKNSYFVINRPRQFGKTTTLSKLQEILKQKYIVIRISFEGIGDKIFSDEELLCKTIIRLFSKSLKKYNKDLSKQLKGIENEIHTLLDLDEAITYFIDDCDKEVILIIDEVDKSSNNQLFLSFLGMLRNKYLSMREGIESSFKSVILAGVHDIKNLKLSIRQEEIKLNSPWNIAINFDVDMSFNIDEIETMIIEYNKANNLNIDTKQISKELYYYTSGYPFLVSRICQIIDEEVLGEKIRNWTTDDVKKAIKIILKEKNTLFESLVKNMENNKELYNLIEEITINGARITYNILNPLIEIGSRYGVFKEYDNRVAINNKLYEQVIYNYMISKVEINQYINKYNYKNDFITNDGGLDFKKILLRYQQFIKEQYSTLDSRFIEREGRLLFLAFIKPIINGVGFDFKEVQISEEKRLDVVVTYNSYKYVVELKIWNGKEYHEKGLKQLVDYLNIQNLDKGYLLVYNFNKKKQYTYENITIDNKEIFIAYV